MYLSFPIQRLSTGLWTAATLSLLLSACYSTPGRGTVATEEASTVAGGRPLVVRRSSADDRVVAYVWQQQGQFVRIETEEPGAGPHQHPVSIIGKQIRQALNQVRFADTHTTPILTEDAMDDIATPLAEALGRASRDQEVTFAVTYRPRGFGRLMARRVTTGRLFRDDDGLQLIIGLLQAPYEEEMLATGQRIAFTPGSRQHRIQQGWSLGSDKLVTHPVAGRDDWVRIDPMVWSVSPGSEKAIGPTPQYRPQPAAQAKPATQPDSYKRVEERLRALKRLRDKGLIPEKVYEQKSRQILEDL